MAENNPHKGHRARAKEEFIARGLSGMADHRALELLLFYAIPQGDVNLLAPDYVSQAAPGKGSMSQSALAYSVSSARNDISSLLGLNSSVLPDPAQILSLMPSGNSPPHAPLLPPNFFF